VIEPSGSVSEIRARWRVALAFSLIGAVLARRVLLNPGWPTDFDQLWHGARALLGGEDPYTIVGPGRPFQWDWPLYYPLPAVLFATPFAVLPIAVARIAFSAIAAGILGWALGPRIRTHWPIVLSASFIISASRTQWAPLLLAAAWMPAIGFVIAAKPTVGVAALAALDSRRLLVAVAGIAASITLCFVIEPRWVSSWLEAVRVAPHIRAAVFTEPAGAVLALAALRWRRPDARLFLALVLVPHTPSLYDLLVLFFVCRTLRETLVLAVLTQALFWGVVLSAPFSGFDSYAEALGRIAVFVVYLPVLIAILIRPNRDEDALHKDVGRTQPGLALVPTNWVDTILLLILMTSGALQILFPLSS
jgi:hypothetical protein